MVRVGRHLPIRLGDALLRNRRRGTAARAASARSHHELLAGRVLRWSRPKSGTRKQRLRWEAAAGARVRAPGAFDQGQYR